MNQSGTIDERELVDYLLGRIQEPERTRLEERLFAEDGLEEQLLATADDLIHDYLTSSLSSDDRERFDAHFLSLPKHQERLAFIRDLGVAVKQVSLDRRSGPTASQRAVVGSSLAFFAIAAALIVLVAAGLLVLTRPTTTGPVTARVIDSPPAGDAPGRSLPVTTTLAVRPATPRGSAVQVVRLPRERDVPVRVSLADETRFVQVEVAVPEGPPSFDAVLRTADGSDAWRIESLAPPASGKALVFKVPAEVLRADAYTLRVEGEPMRDAAPPVLEYRLRVVRER